MKSRKLSLKLMQKEQKKQKKQSSNQKLLKEQENDVSIEPESH